MLEQLLYWHWFALGLLLLILEITGAGGYLLWIGLAALITGICKWLIPGLGWELQCLVFGLGAVLTTLGWHRYLKTRTEQSDKPHLNQRSASYVGRTLVLSEAIVNGRGKVRVDDSNWDVTGPDLPAGARVRVLAARGLLLNVEQEEAGA